MYRGIIPVAGLLSGCSIASVAFGIFWMHLIWVNYSNPSHDLTIDDG